MIIDKSNENWQKELTDFVKTDLDGRFWFEDMVEAELRSAIPMVAVDDLRGEIYAEAEEYWSESGFDAGYEAGYEQGESAAAEAEEDAFNDGWESYKSGGVNPYTGENARVDIG